MSHVDTLLGRYEGEAQNGMTMFVEFRRVTDSEFTYSYGGKIGQSYVPKETITVNEYEIMDRIANAMGKNYHRVADVTEITEEEKLEQSIRGFSLSNWAERK